jgi:hypothetical protein
LDHVLDNYEDTAGTLLGRLAWGDSKAKGALWQRVQCQILIMATVALGRERGGHPMDAAELAKMRQSKSTAGSREAERS